MEIKYKNNDLEVSEYIFFKRVNSDAFKEDVKRTKNLYYLMSALVALYGAFQLFRMGGSGDEATKASYLSTAVSMSTVAIMSLLFSLAVPKTLEFFNRREIKRELKKKPVEHPETTITIDSKTFSWKQDKEKGSVKLTNEMLVVEKTDSYYVDTKKGFFVIPKRAFESVDELDEFKKLMNIEDRIAKTEAMLKLKKK